MARRRGGRPWRERGSRREQLLAEDLVDYVFDVTGVEVTVVQARALRYCIPRWVEDADTKELIREIEQEKRQRTVNKHMQIQAGAQ